MSITLSFAAEIYSIEAVKKAAYRFSDRLSVEITPRSEVIECELLVRAGVPASDLDELAQEFRIEVLDQDLRATIAAETAPLRNAILAYAFSNTGLQGGE